MAHLATGLTNLRGAAGPLSMAAPAPGTRPPLAGCSTSITVRVCCLPAAGAFIEMRLGVADTKGEGIIEMSRAPDWTADEFETLLQGGHRAVEELASVLRGRTVETIEVVQHGIHNYHVGRGTSMLSEMMLRRLGDRSRPVICPVCGMLAND
jgi:hypothetical protein